MTFDKKNWNKFDYAITYIVQKVEFWKSAGPITHDAAQFHSSKECHFTEKVSIDTYYPLF